LKESDNELKVNDANEKEKFNLSDCRIEHWWWIKIKNNIDQIFPTRRIES
jgi:hypothetical protein